MKTTPSFLLSLVASAALDAISAAHAQTTLPTDAGRVLQGQQATPVLPAVAPNFRIDLPATGQRAAPGGPKVQVRVVQFSGHTMLDAPTLLAALDPDALGQEFDLAGLQDLAERATLAYRAAGYPFARVFVPVQDLKDGVLRLEVVEGRYGRVIAESTDPQVQSVAQARLAPLVPGAVIAAGPLERATLLLTDLGLDLQPIMRPGPVAGTGDLVVQATPTQPATRWELGLDNHGNRYTGAYRVRASVRTAGVLTVGDQWVAQGQASDGQLLSGQVSYSMPLDANGWRANLSHAQTQYELGGTFASLQAMGTARATGVGLSYPMLRSVATNLSLSAQLQHKRLRDEQRTAGTDERKSSTLLPLGLNFDHRDDAGTSYGAFTLAVGRLRLDDALQANDALSAKTAGQFTVLRLDLNRLHNLPTSDVGPLTGFVRLSAQWASKNLDSSEGFSLGGPNGVRAYPVGEGSGDAGWLAQFELRTRLGNAAPYVFADLGAVRVDAQPWQSSTNQRQLSGAGLGVRSVQGAFNVDASLAWALRGGEPQADPRHAKPRFWVSATWSL
jgi:hemolysin activation/secretion protein